MRFIVFAYTLLMYARSTTGDAPPQSKHATRVVAVQATRDRGDIASQAISIDLSAPNAPIVSGQNFPNS